MHKQTSFEDLNVYKDALSLIIRVYQILQKEELKKEFGFADQLKRATLSISNNIAEGFERETDAELIRFLYFSKGSAGEVRNILNVLKVLALIENDEYDELKEKALNISKQLSNFIKFVLKRKAEKGK